jgi:hypothetical protein
MPNNILIRPGSAKIEFSGSSANTVTLDVESNGSVVFSGSSGAGTLVRLRDGVTSGSIQFGGVVTGSNAQYRIVLPVGTNLYAVS